MLTFLGVVVYSISKVVSMSILGVVIYSKQSVNLSSLGKYFCRHLGSLVS